MMRKRNINRLQLSKLLSVLLLSGCLLFLTGINFFIYTNSPGHEISSLFSGSDDEEQPSTPVEEKAPSGTNTSIQEEFLHEKHSLHDITWLEVLTNHRIHDAGKLTIVHFELVSPPPDRSFLS